MKPSVLVVGSGVFGVTAAGELCRRGYQVDLVDPGPLPHPDASSTDISKAIRADYGADGFYADLATRAIRVWKRWNELWDDPPYREIGILMLARESFDRGGFEADCHDTLTERGFPLERLSGAALGRRFPTWKDTGYADAYFNPRAGWSPSGEVTARLLAEARDAGVHIRTGQAASELLQRGDAVCGVRLADGSELEADQTLVAAGAWTPELVPELRDRVWATAQPVVHLAPEDPAPFDARRFPVWCADIARSGWYGFPADGTGRLKVGHHGPGRRWRRGDPLLVRPGEVRRCLDFVRGTFGLSADPRVLATRLCLYCDTFDGDFLIDRVPGRPGLVVAAGGSGHGFKFAPLLGGIIAEAVERELPEWAGRFAWRELGARRWETARSCRMNRTEKGGEP